MEATSSPAYPSNRFHRGLLLQAKDYHPWSLPPALCDLDLFILIMTTKARKRAIARNSLTSGVVLIAISSIADMDWEVGTEDAATGPFFFHPGHDVKPWMPDVTTRYYRDVGRQLVVEALSMLCSRLSPLSVRANPGGSPWHAVSEEEHHSAMDRLRDRLIRRLRDAVRSHDVPGLIAIAENRSLEDVLAERTYAPPMAPEDLESLLADFEEDVFVEGDILAKNLVNQAVPSATALKKAAGAIKRASWEVVPTPGGHWTVRGGREFKNALNAVNGSDERSVAQTLVARAVKYLTLRTTHQINDLKRGACRFQSDIAVHDLICGRVSDAVRSEGYGGLARLIGSCR